jgi:hypothetical protein
MMRFWANRRTNSGIAGRSSFMATRHAIRSVLLGMRAVQLRVHNESFRMRKCHSPESSGCRNARVPDSENPRKAICLLGRNRRPSWKIQQWPWNRPEFLSLITASPMMRQSA